MTEQLFGIIDAQRGFMPGAEGDRLDRAGFGELPVPDGEKIVPVVKRLLWAFGQQNTFTTQDYHPKETAHFSDNPNFTTNWPVHCVAGTPGAMLHPDLESNLMPSVARFFKGQECLENGEDDLSYSGYYGTTETGLTLPEWLLARQAEHVFLGGLALEHCVGKTALDLRNKAGLEVTVVRDATRGIAEEPINEMLAQFKAHGIAVADSRDVLQDLKAA